MPRMESARGLCGHSTPSLLRRGLGNESVQKEVSLQLNRIVSNAEILQKALLFLSTEINSSLFEDLEAGEH